MSSPGMTFDERYRVIESRDTRFDGQFVTAVRSTGIYCRPSCPARTPKPSNVTFYATSAAAHEAGYRACKRCLPEAAPGSPEWNLRGDTAGRAMRLIADGIVEREGVPGLAARLGYSPAAPHPAAHRRARRRTAGAQPRAPRAHRADAARRHRPSGRGCRVLGRLRQRAPVQRHRSRGVRHAAARAAGAAPAALPHAEPPDAPGAIDLVLPHRGPLDAAGVFAWMRARAVAGVEVATDTTFARTLRLAGGPAWFEIRLDDVGRVRLRARLTHLGDLSTLVTRARRLFDLDADPIAVDEALSRHPELAPLVAAVPGIRVPGRRRPARDAHPGDGRASRSPSRRRGPR